MTKHTNIHINKFQNINKGRKGGKEGARKGEGEREREREREREIGNFFCVTYSYLLYSLFLVTMVPTPPF